MKKRFVFGLLGFCVLFFAASLRSAELPSPYEVVWKSPGRSTYETMPLGNGEVGLNAWIDERGDLRFYISRIDSLDENARILKLGALRFCFGEESEQKTARFEQRLDTRRGVLEAKFGEESREIFLRLWVDAHRPVIVLETTFVQPDSVTVFTENWRNEREKLPSVETGDLNNKSDDETWVEADTVLTELKDAIGWYHRNTHSDSYERVAAIQGMDTFPRANPILHRTFGVLVRNTDPERLDDGSLRSKTSKTHRFEIVALTKHPATPEEWTAEATAILDSAQKIDPATRFERHVAWWNEFQDRSWIRITPGKTVSNRLNDPVPANKHSVRVGFDQSGGSTFPGELGRVSLISGELPPETLKNLAEGQPNDKSNQAGSKREVFSKKPAVLENTADLSFAGGMTVEAWIRPERIGVYARIVDKITPGGSDGFLFDMTPGGGLRWICGTSAQTTPNDTLQADRWQHVAVTVSPRGNARFFLDGRSLDACEDDGFLSEEFILSRAYALQRYVTACAGRGTLPIKFNGSIFTVPEKDRPGDADYRRWGTGYWFQNTRLPYLSMPSAGDFEMMEPFFRTYFDMLPLCKYRTKLYLGIDGAYYPECVYFWGDVFPESYGRDPIWKDREDKLQQSRWHKWEWVGGLEIALMMLEYWQFTGDDHFLKEKAIPFSQEILTFFDRYYSCDENGKLVMHPSQSLETWWECTNPMPEIAGLHAVTDRLLELPESATTTEHREFWSALKKKLPALPTTTSKDGKTMLAPAEKFDVRRNIENPELYAVYPFRLISYDKPNAEWGIEALKHRLDRGAFGWRQDDLFMSYLGLADDAGDYLVQRAKNKHVASRFPVFWGPNYDWIPDQDHGGVLCRGVQSLVMQYEGRRIDLFPAWPRHWNCEFKLHAPYQTVLEGRLEEGKLIELKVTPESRRNDVRILLQEKSVLPDSQKTFFVEQPGD